MQKLLSTFNAFSFLFFFLCLRLLVKRGLSDPYAYSYIHMHDLYKYIIYKLATPLGIVHWIDLDNNFYNDNPLFYKTGHQFIGLLVYSERKKIIENSKILPLVQKLIYCSRPAIYFVIRIFAQTSRQRFVPFYWQVCSW